MILVLFKTFVLNIMRCLDFITVKKLKHLLIGAAIKGEMTSEHKYMFSKKKSINKKKIK